MSTRDNFVSLVIRAYNEAEHIGKLMDGIACQDLGDLQGYEVILVDSGSTDQTREIAREKGARIVSIKKSDFSFGRALNYGCEAAEGEYLLFASAHVYPVYPDWIAKMVAPFRSDERVGLVYGRQVGNAQTQFSEEQIFKKWFPENSDYNQQTPFCNNANCAIRKSLWEKLPYDESLSGLEDMDWAKKIMDQGIKVAYEAEAEIVHVHEETPDKIMNRYMREAIAMKKVHPDFNFSLWTYWSLLVRHIFSDSIEAVKTGVFFKEVGNIFMFRKNQFWGTYKGYNQDGNISKELKNRFYYPNTILSKERSSESGNRTKIDYGATNS